MAFDKIFIVCFMLFVAVPIVFAQEKAIEQPMIVEVEKVVYKEKEAGVEVKRLSDTEVEVRETYADNVKVYRQEEVTHDIAALELEISNLQAKIDDLNATKDKLTAIYAQE